MTKAHPVVILESPFHHWHEEGRKLHQAYLELCLRDSLLRGEIPIATHKLYTAALDDSKPEERKLGMETLTRFFDVSEYSVFYFDLGFSPGMHWGFEMTRQRNRTFHFRSLYNHPWPGFNNIPERTSL